MDGAERKKGKLLVFGGVLCDVCEVEKTPIPRVAEDIFTYLENQALELEGIFRIPGNSITVDQLKAHYNGENDEITISTCKDRHAVAGLLKLYLRELPDPLLTYRFYETFIAVQKNPDFDYRMLNLRKLINALPISHKNLLTRLIAFLIKISAYSEMNKMTEANLAIVFGPNLLRPKSESMLRMIEDARHVNGVTLSLLEQFEFLVSCTSSIPRRTGDCESPLPSPRAMKIEFSQVPPSGFGSKRRAGKFNFKELDTITDQTKNQHEISEMEPEPSTGPTNNSRSKILAAVTRAFDLQNPLEYISHNLAQNAEQMNRPSELEDMSVSEKQDEKAQVKLQLRSFDHAFKAKHGRMPTKLDKEPLRPIYQRYRDLTKAIENHEQEQKEAEEFDDTNSLGSNTEYIALKKEKKRLQYILHQFQADFIKQNGRKVQYAQDRAPIQTQYDEYKKLKAKISSFEETQNLINTMRE